MFSLIPASQRRAHRAVATRGAICSSLHHVPPVRLAKRCVQHFCAPAQIPASPPPLGGRAVGMAEQALTLIARAWAQYAVLTGSPCWRSRSPR